MAWSEAFLPGVHAITSPVDIDGRLSWFPPSVSGVDPHHCYLVEASDRLLMVDTGTGAHADAIAREVERIADGRRIVIFLTRIEVECTGNLGYMLGRLTDVELATAVPLPPFELIHLPRPDLRETVRVTHIPFGETLAPVGFPDIRILQPPVHTLSTSWLHDSRSGVLFSSDFFAADFMSDSMDTSFRTESPAQPVEQIRDILLYKFDWLKRAEKSRLRDAFDRLFSTRDLRAICPTHGRIALGESICTATVSAYRAAMFS